MIFARQAGAIGVLVTLTLSSLCAGMAAVIAGARHAMRKMQMPKGIVT